MFSRWFGIQDTHTQVVIEPHRRIGMQPLGKIDDESPLPPTDPSHIVSDAGPPAKLDGGGSDPSAIGAAKKEKQVSINTEGDHSTAAPDLSSNFPSPRMPMFEGEHSRGPATRGHTTATAMVLHKHKSDGTRIKVTRLAEDPDLPLYHELCPDCDHYVEELLATYVTYFVLQGTLTTTTTVKRPLGSRPKRPASSLLRDRRLPPSRAEDETE